MMRGKKPIQNCPKTFKIAKKCKKLPNCQNGKNCQKIAILLKIAKNRGRDFPEGQMGTFSDQISGHFGSSLKYDLKKVLDLSHSGLICPTLGLNLPHLSYQLAVSCGVTHELSSHLLTPHL